MEIIILGSGCCSNCKTLYQNTVAALQTCGKQATLSKEEDMARILSYNVMNLPALVIDGKVASAGRVLKPQEITDILAKH